jgi:hypothetical protein
MRKISIFLSAGLAIMLGLNSCKKEDCIIVEQVDIVANKTPYYGDSTFTLQVPVQPGLTSSEYSWSKPDGSSENGNVLTFSRLTQFEEGEYILTIGKSGCGIERSYYNLDIQIPTTLPCELDTNVMSFSGSTSFTFTSVTYNSSFGGLDAGNSFANLSLNFASSIEGRPREGLYFISNGNEEQDVSVSLNYGFSNWVFRGGNLYVANENNKLTIKGCNLPVDETQSNFETTAKLLLSEQ